MGQTSLDHKTGSFWWKAHIPLIQIYKNHAKIKVNRGDTVSFWFDTWGVRNMQLAFPELFSYAKNNTITVEAVRNTTEWEEIFHTPLSTQAWSHLQQIPALLTGNTMHKDTWMSNGKKNYSSMVIYKQLIPDDICSSLIRKTWKSASRLKHKIFF